MHCSVPTGYTLVELLVVIAIIMILAAILLPVFEQATKSAEAIKCLTNLRNIGFAAQLYATDYAPFYPPALIETREGERPDGWDVLLYPYLRTDLIYLCPADENPTYGPLWMNSLKHSYGINLDVAMVNGYMGASLTEAELNRPSDTILFFELAQEHLYGWRASWGNMSQYVAARHSRHERGNFVFVAGHAKCLRPADTLTEHVNMWYPY